MREVNASEEQEQESSEWNVRELSGSEFDELSAASRYGGFQQTSEMAALAQSDGMQTQYVGLVDSHDAPVAGALVAFSQGRFGVEGSLWLGPLCNGNNREQMTALTEGLREAAERVHAISLTCWPNQVYCVRDSQGKAMAEPNDEMVREYERLGWKHAGFARGYGALMNRWNYVKDLREFSNAGELLASYAKNTRRNVKIARNSGVEVRRLNRSELNVFHDICELSSERQHFVNRSLDYFERVYDAFGDKAEFMVAEVHLDRYLQSWEEKLAKFSKDAERLERSLEHTKYPDDVRKKLDTAQKNVESARRRIENAHERIARDGEVVPVAVGLFMWHERELVYFSSGSDDRYAKFYALTALQHEMMSRCLERGVTRYNFYGISGVFDDPEDDGRGVLEFKQGFNGYVEELPGEFTLPVSKLRYGVSDLAHKLLRH